MQQRLRAQHLMGSPTPLRTFGARCLAWSTYWGPAVLVYGACVGLLLAKSLPCDFFREPILFGSECALFLRYTAMVVQDGAVPWWDHAVQVPEGMEVYRETPLLMEYTIGWLYRGIAALVPALSLQAFIVLFKICFASTSVIAVYLLHRLLHGPVLGAMLAAAFYACCWGFYGRVVSVEFYLLEHFALPFLFFAVYFFMRALQRDQVRDTLVGGVLMALALASWQLPQFFLLLLTGLVCVQWILHQSLAMRFLRHFFLFLAPPVAGGLFYPHIQHLAVSPLVLLAIALLATLWLTQRVRMAWRPRVLCLLVVFSLLFAATHGQRSDDYTHVFTLLLDKLRYLGVKPADPSHLPFETRVYWTAGYHTSTLYDMVSGFGVLLLAAFAPLRQALCGYPRLDTPRQLLVTLTLACCVLYGLMTRMAPFATFFLVLFISPAVVQQRLYTTALVLLLLLDGVAYLGPSTSVVCRPYPARFADLVERYTEPNSVILAEFYHAPTFLTYQGRRIPLHAIFENTAFRQKVKEYYIALAGTEEEFHRFATRVGAHYFLFEPDMYFDTGPESLRYFTDTLWALPPEAALERFVQLLTDTPWFRLVASSPVAALYQVK